MSAALHKISPYEKVRRENLAEIAAIKRALTKK